MAKGKNDTANVIAPPPFISLACILVGVGLEWLWPTAFAALWMRWTLGGGLIDELLMFLQV